MRQHMIKENDMAGLNGDWYEALKGEFAKPYYKRQ